MKARHLAPLLLGAALAAACGGETAPQEPRPAPEARDEPAPPPAIDAAPADETGDDEPAGTDDPWPDRRLPFDVSPDDRAALGTGFSGATKAPADSGYEFGARIAGLQETGALAAAGIENGDLIVELDGVRFDAPAATVIERLREQLDGIAPDTRVSLVYTRKDEITRIDDFLLGRRPPSFAQLDTPPQWFEETETPNRLRVFASGALELDGGEARLEDTLDRHRRRFEKRDVFRLRRTVEAQMHPWHQRELATKVTDAIRLTSSGAAFLAAERPIPRGSPPSPAPPTLEAELDRIEAALVAADEKVRAALSTWSEEEREWVAGNFQKLTDRVAMGEYLHGDEDVDREYGNRRLIKLLESVDRAAIATAAGQVEWLFRHETAVLEQLLGDDAAHGLIASRDTAAGRIEIWGAGNQRHTKRCAFRFDLAGNDSYLDTAGRADLGQPISINIDVAGDDTYGASAPFCQGGALGGVGMLVDLSGDDQYLAQQWSQGAAAAGFGLLYDGNGRDTYRGLEMCQGVALVGAGVLADSLGADTYSGDRFCQGVGFAGGVGALRDASGDDRYACTGRYESEYGEDGVFSGWGQGVGFGFRHVTSGGIGVLHDLAGDDVYEAGNFSQGGAYFYAWGILRDESGNDRYIGSRYAQGYAAHQAAGTFIEERGDDLYQSHANVAQGLSWDETSVLFWEGDGDDVYETKGFSLAAAAHNGMVVFYEGGGDDRYPALPAKANSNNYHGGKSFALFLDAGGRDTYGKTKSDNWNDRVFWRHDGAYHLDLPAGTGPLTRFVRTPPAESDR